MLSQFLGNFQKQTKGLEVSQEQAQNGYSTYTENLERALCALNRQLYRNSDPQECALETLKTACDFYDGDWAGIIIVDFNLHIWSPLWWYNKSSDDKTTLVLNSLESSEYLDRWVRAMRTNHPIAIQSTDNKKSLSQTEYDLYQRLHAHSLLAVPFKPHPMGFLVIRNPQRYMYQINMLRTLAYFAENAINRWKLLERTKLIKHPKDIQHENEIIINVFGTFEIYTSCGVLTQDTIKSPIMCRLLFCFSIEAARRAHRSSLMRSGRIQRKITNLSSAISEVRSIDSVWAVHWLQGMIWLSIAPLDIDSTQIFIS